MTAEKVEVVISAYDGWLKGAEGVSLTYCKYKYKLTFFNFVFVFGNRTLYYKSLFAFISILLSFCNSRS